MFADLLELGERIPVINWTYADTAAREAATGFVSTDVDKFARQIDDDSIWVLTDHAGPTWARVSGSVTIDTDVTLAADSDALVPSQKAVKAYVDTSVAASGGAGDYILIQDQKASGTNGGTFTSGAWQTRDLNTEVSDAGGHASVASNQITLAAGTYRIRARAAAYRVGVHQLKLYNVTDAADVVIGSSQFGETGAPPTTMAFLDGRFTIAGTKVFEIRHRCSSTFATFGYGNAVSFGVVEVYTSVELIRE